MTSFRSISMPAGFRRHLVGKTLRNVCYSDVTLCRQVLEYVDIFLNYLIKVYPNDMVNLHKLTPHIVCQVIPTKWRSYRDHRFCDDTSPYVCCEQALTVERRRCMVALGPNELQACTLISYSRPERSANRRPAEGQARPAGAKYEPPPTQRAARQPRHEMIRGELNIWTVVDRQLITRGSSSRFTRAQNSPRRQSSPVTGQWSEQDAVSCSSWHWSSAPVCWQ